MNCANLIFPHQLYDDISKLDKEFPVYIVEEFLFFRQYKFHKQKIAFHRASMKSYAQKLEKEGFQVEYVESLAEESDVRKLLPHLSKLGVKELTYFDPVDNWLGKRIVEAAQALEIRSTKLESQLFLNSSSEIQSYFSDRKKYNQGQFYIKQRKEKQILVDDKNAPLGGKWSFDEMNRKKYPRKKTPPSVKFPDESTFYTEAVSYTITHFEDYPGSLSNTPIYPIDHLQAKEWLEAFLVERFEEFGTYEDAIVANEIILNHSVLSPLMNVGLLTPQYIVDRAIEYANKNDIPLNSLEGFVRQIIGWREFIRGIYETRGSEERTKNYWGFTRKIPASFYDGTTGIEPIDIVIKKVLETGYCHHIERLMVLGNFMILCEFDPDEVYRWFMELFIDAYDWVMVPNVYGMSQFADGGIFATKPYISGSNYLKKMSDFAKGDWQKIWDGLFWRFMSVHRDFFGQNPRLSMLLGTLDRMDEVRRKDLMDTAEGYLGELG